jgi:hypothetical protein
MLKEQNKADPSHDDTEQEQGTDSHFWLKGALWLLHGIASI